jgi:DNA-binding response OmpR family regulator
VNHRSAASQLEKTKRYLLRTSNGGYCLRLQLLGEGLKNLQGFSLEAERFGLISVELQIIPTEGLCVDERNGKVYLNSAEIKNELSDLQYQALLYLAQNVGRVVPRYELYEFLHSKDETYLPTDQSLDALIYRLRLTLGDKEQRYLQTLRKRGYVLKQATLIPK